MRTIIIAILAGVLVVGACKNKESMPSNNNKWAEWPPLVGRSLVGENALTGPELPLSTEKMLAIARRYYPRIRVEDYDLPHDFRRALEATPEHQALSMAQYEAWQRVDQFCGLVRAVREALPPDSYVADHTVPGHDAAYEAVFALPRPRENPVRRILVLQVSYLVPYYFLYESHSRRMDGESNTLRVLHDTTPELTIIRDVVEREVAWIYGYYRLTPEIANIPVPDIFIDNYYEEPAILGVALLAPRKW